MVSRKAILFVFFCCLAVLLSFWLFGTSVRYLEESRTLSAACLGMRYW